MGLEIPAEVQHLSWIVEADWPKGDETAMRRCAEAWRQAAADIDELIPDLQGDVAKVLGAVQGVAADEFERYWKTFVSTDPRHLPKLAERCERLAGQLERGAGDIEYAKYLFIALLIGTSTEIAVLTAGATATLGAAAAGIPAVEAAAQVTSRAIAQHLLMSVARGAAVSLLQGAGLDVLVRAIQLARGDRADLDLQAATPPPGGDGTAPGVGATIPAGPATGAAAPIDSASSGSASTDTASGGGTATDGTSGGDQQGGIPDDAVPASTGADPVADHTEDAEDTDPSKDTAATADTEDAEADGDEEAHADAGGATADASPPGAGADGASAAPPSSSSAHASTSNVSSASGDPFSPDGTSADSGGSSYDGAAGAAADGEPQPGAPAVSTVPTAWAMPTPAEVAGTDLAGAGPTLGDLSTPPPDVEAPDGHSASASSPAGEPSGGGHPATDGTDGTDQQEANAGADPAHHGDDASNGSAGAPGGGVLPPSMMGGHASGSAPMAREHSGSSAIHYVAITEPWADAGEPESAPPDGAVAGLIPAATPFSSADGENWTGAPDYPQATAPPSLADDGSADDSSADAAVPPHPGSALFMAPMRVPGPGRPAARPRGGSARAARPRPRLRLEMAEGPRTAPHGTPDETRPSEVIPPDLPQRLHAAYLRTEATPAGRSLYGPAEQDMRELARRVRPDQSRYVLDGIGTRTGMRAGDRQLDAAAVAGIVRCDPAWAGRELVLLSGDAVRNGTRFAADLARELGVPVIVPNGPAWSDHRGRVFRAAVSERLSPDGDHGLCGPTWPPDRGWRTAHPDSVPAPPGPDAVVDDAAGDDGAGDDGAGGHHEGVAVAAVARALQ